MKLTTSAQMRELDRIAIEERHIPSVELMERAAEGVAAAVLTLLPDQAAHCRIAALCGAGNNGGDGIAAARLLFFRGMQVRCFLVGRYERLTPDSLEMTRRLSDCGVELESFDPENAEQLRYIRQCDAVIDAVFGVGLSREVAEGSVFAAAIDAMNQSRGKIAAADIASGVEADTGRILGRAVRADSTVTFTFPKIGQAVGDGAVCSGEVTVREIGIPADLKEKLAGSVQTVEKPFVQWALPRRRIDGHKGTFGKLLVVGGAVGYTGAPYLAAAAAVRTGCGLVSLGVPELIWPVEAAKCVSAMPFPLPEKGGMLSEKALPQILEKLSGCDVLALGPGLGRSERTARLVWELLKTEKPVVLDADGINALAAHKDVLRESACPIVLTPHAGEFLRLGGDPLHRDPVSEAMRVSAETGCVVLLKGCRTVLTDGLNVYRNATGNPGLATGGSGDVLAGMIVSLLGQHVMPLEAAAAAAWLHGAAADLAAQTTGEYSLLPEDVLDSLPRLLKQIGGV